MYGSIMQELSGEIGELSRDIGVDEETAKAAIGTAVPLMLGAMSRQASTSDGALALFDSLNHEHEHEEGALSGLASLLKNPLALAAGGALVSKMFGGHQSPVEAGLSNATGLGGEQTKKMMMALTPVVLGYLARHSREKNLDAGGIANLLRDEEVQLKAHSPELEGLLGVLDLDHDGSVMDEVEKMGAAFMANMFRQH